MSSSKKIIAVLGATGNQGGSVVSLWASNSDLQSKYTIRAITRDASKPSAEALKKKGAEVVSADLNDRSSLDAAVKGAYGVFAVTNFWEGVDGQKELEQGKAIADAAFAAGVKHIIFSSLPHTTKLTEGKLPNIDHFVAKAEVEEYIEEHKSKSGAIASYYMPAFFMSNFAGMGFIAPGQDGVLTMAAPYSGSAQTPLIDIVADTGSYVWGIFEAGKEADGVEVQAVSDWKTGEEITATFTKFAQAGEVKFAQIPRDVFKGFLVQKMGETLGEEMTQNMDLIGEYAYYGKNTYDKQDQHDKFLLKGTKKTSLEEYIKKNAPIKLGGQ